MSRKRKPLSQPTLNSTKSKKLRQSDESDIETNMSSSQTNPGRAGRVLRLYLRNFMCHSSLEIKLDPNTNYVIGRNGSGKSAILTALIVGLGGNARQTSRGANMKAFIKVGQSSSLVEITLSNTGPMAYHPKIYGREIIVIRSFTDTGGNSYKLKSSSGEVISSSVRDIHRVMEALNIHVDNPICILNQDVARTFLNTNDPSKKYIMFMKATNLENVKAQYKIALKNKKQTVMSLKSKGDSLKKLELEVGKWLKKFQAFEIMGEVENKKKTLEIEAIWAQINVIEEEYTKKQSTVAELTNDIQNFSDMIKNKSEKKSELSKNIEDIRKQLLEIRNEEESNQALMNEKKNVLHNFRQSFAAKKHEMNTIEAGIKRKEADQKNIENEINNSSSYHTNRLKVIQERDAKLVEFERKLHEIKQLFETAENDLMQTRNAHNLKQTEERNISSELSELNGHIKQRQVKIRSMKVDENNAISVYGQNMAKILESINANKEQFIQMPRGPIGSYIKLKDKKWALAIEDFIQQGILMSFCVDNHKDAALLTKIFNQVGGRMKPTIICSKFFHQVHDYSRNKVDTPNGCIAMIDAMTIQDTIIQNCLIDQSSIETVLLIASNELARQLMSEAARVPKNCTRAITLNGDQFYPDPNYRSYACRNKNPRYLQVSAAEAIKLYEAELQSYLQNHNTIERQACAVSNDVKKLANELQNVQMKISKLDMVQNRIQRDINDLKVQNLPPEPNIEILTEELKEITKIIQSKTAELEKLAEENAIIKNELKTAENEFSELNKISKGLGIRMKPLLDDINDSETKLKQVNINAKFHTDKIKQCTERLTQAKRDVERKQSVLAEKLSAAEVLGDRVQTDRALEVILSELQETEQELTEIRTAKGDRVVVSETYMQLQKKYDKVKSEIVQVQECLDEMVETVESRARHYQKLAEYIGIRVREMFIGVLRIRQFKGTIQIDHEKQILELVVIPQHGSSQGSGHTHILSGGERSYSTVAFLHALWQVMEYPFYFLDEFDVFMDKVNRRTVMDILLEHAKEHSDLQFVFLTPQDISSVIGDKHIVVHRMADPLRNAEPR